MVKSCASLARLNADAAIPTKVDCRFVWILFEAPREALRVYLWVALVFLPEADLAETGFREVCWGPVFAELDGLLDLVGFIVLAFS